jgi:RNA polymerase-binding transcription factor DksA
MKDSRARSLLEAERSRLEEVRDSFMLGELSEIEQESVDELSSIDQHPADLGTETFEREKAESILVSTEAHLGDVERAFGKLEEGRYGICETCGQPIPDERLEARPATRFCFEDQEKVEQGIVTEL